MRKILTAASLSLLAIVALIAGCKKTGNLDNLTVPPAQSSFANKTLGTFYVKNDPNTYYKIPVGITNVASVDRTVTVSVTSPTGAVAGTQYSLPTMNVVIPAGKALDSLTVKGNFAGYPGTRQDTLVFTITGGDVPPSSFNNTFKLVLRRYCDVVGANLMGAYANSRDYDRSLAGTPSAAKYTVTLANFTPVGTAGTSATVLIKNLGGTGDIGFAPFAATDPAATGITATLDWSNPANFTVSIPKQNYVTSLYSYGQSTITGTGTFSSCDQTFTITYTVGVGAGNFSAVVSNLVR